MNAKRIVQGWWSILNFKYTVIWYIILSFIALSLPMFVLAFSLFFLTRSHMHIQQFKLVLDNNSSSKWMNILSKVIQWKPIIATVISKFVWWHFVNGWPFECERVSKSSDFNWLIAFIHEACGNSSKSEIFGVLLN